MKAPEIKYYFSAKTSVFVLILLLVFIAAFSYSACTIYSTQLITAIILAAVVVIISVFALPMYVRFIKALFNKRPALILNSKLLIDNINGLEYEWSDIKEIIEGPANDENLEGLILIYFKLHDMPAKIAPSIVQGDKNDLLNNLVNYHKQFSN